MDGSITILSREKIMYGVHWMTMNRHNCFQNTFFQHPGAALNLLLGFSLEIQSKVTPRYHLAWPHPLLVEFKYPKIQALVFLTLRFAYCSVNSSSEKLYAREIFGVEHSPRDRWGKFRTLLYSSTFSPKPVSALQAHVNICMNS